MRAFIIRRLFYAFLTVIGGTFVIFGLSRMSGDPRVLYLDDYSKPDPETWERLGEKFHLNDPIPVQYYYWLKDVVRGDFGDSIARQRPVKDVIYSRLWNSVQLGFVAWAFGTLIGIPLGVLSAVKRGRPIDYIGRGFALLGQSLPSFWIAIMAILIFSGTLGWLPSAGKGEGFAISNFILPTIVLGWLPAAGYLRLTRSAMLEVLDSEYIKFSRAKGVSKLMVLWKHAFRNALLAPLTFSALLLLGFVTGTTVAETVFAWPGLGRLAVESVFGNDFPVLAAIMLLMVVLYAGVVLTLDLLYAVVDPRIRYS
jgi:peptide/nickel transport system permease protein